MLEIKITESAVKKEKPTDESHLGFGQIFTDHMFVMNYDEGKGWHEVNPKNWTKPTGGVFLYETDIGTEDTDL